MSDLSKKTMSELVELYNENAEQLGDHKAVKKFSDKKTAIRRVATIIQVRKDRAAGGEEPAAPAAPAKPKQKRASRADFNLDEGMHRTVRTPSEGKKPSKRFRVKQMLETGDGATIEEVMAAIGWDRRTAYDGIRLLNKYSGRKLVHNKETGKIRLIEDGDE